MSPVIYLTNRATRIFDAAFSFYNAKSFTGEDTLIDFLYFDTYGGKTPPQDVGVFARLMDRVKTIPLDHKYKLAERLIANEADYPKTYLSPDQVPKENNKLWFVKNPLSTAGKNLYICRTRDLERNYREGDVIQEAIADLDLINKRKYTIRSYVLVFDNAVYVYPDSMFVVHAKPYHPRSLDPEVQFLHRGYASKDSGIKMYLASDHDRYRDMHAKIIETAEKIFPLFNAELGNEAGGDTFCLFGLDLLAVKDDAMALIEVNDRPNLIHTPFINEALNVNVVRSMIELIFPEMELTKPDDVTRKHFEKIYSFQE